MLLHWCLFCERDAGTAPEFSGTANGYGLTAVAGNVREWSDDSLGANRVLCGGRWQGRAPEARCAAVSFADPASASSVIGFRTVQRASSSAFAVTGSEVPVDTRDYLLTVSSEHGTPVPSLGINVYAWRASVTCSVPPKGGTPNFIGTPNVGGITLTSLTSSVLWNWDANYWMALYGLERRCVRRLFAGGHHRPDGAPGFCDRHVLG